MEINNGLGGTGHESTSSYSGCGRVFCPAFPENLTRTALSETPEFVIISGGQDDLSNFRADPLRVGIEIAATFTKARELYPTTQVIVVGPSRLLDVDQIVTDFDTVVQSAAASAGATFISLIDPDALDAASAVLAMLSHSQ